MPLNAPMSELAIINMAATTLDDFHITSLDITEESTPLARFSISEFGFVRDQLLEMHPWTFAKTRAYVGADGAAPPFGWDTAYTWPEDCLQVLPLRYGGDHNAPLIPFENEGRKILTNHTGALPLIYIRRETNTAKFSPTFARAFGQYLAMIAAQRVTGKESYTTKATRAYDRAIADAMFVNARGYGTPEDQVRSNVIDIRGNG